MQEGGDIHIVDASNGTVSHEYVAKAKFNSNWACDKENQTMLVVGDVGRACLFDISFKNQRFTKDIINNSVSLKRSFTLGPISE